MNKFLSFKYTSSTKIMLLNLQQLFHTLTFNFIFKLSHPNILTARFWIFSGRKNWRVHTKNLPVKILMQFPITLPKTIFPGSAARFGVSLETSKNIIRIFGLKIFLGSVKFFGSLANPKLIKIDHFWVLLRFRTRTWQVAEKVQKIFSRQSQKKQTKSSMGWICIN